MGVLDDITSGFNQVSDSLGATSADIQTSAASISGDISTISKLFGDSNRGTPNAPPISSLVNSRFLMLGIVILVFAILLKWGKK